MKFKKWDFYAKPKKPNLIVWIVLSVLLPPVTFYFVDVPMYFAPLLSVILIAYLIYAFISEKKADKKADSAEPNLADGSRFNSAEWRDKYLEYVQKHPFEEPSPKGMKADISRRYRRLISIPFILFGVLMVVGSGSIIFSDEDFKFLYAIGGLLIGAFLIYVNGAKYIFSVPLRQFYKKCNDKEAVESSYNDGKILSYKTSGVNIGSSYTVIYNSKEVLAVDNSKITSVSRNIVRLKKYQDNIYAGEEYIHKLRISADMEYYVQLNEFQVEAAIMELRRFTWQSDKTTYTKAYYNEIVT